MGEAVQMLPPMPEALRMGGPANQRSCSTTARSVEVCGQRRMAGREAGSRMDEHCIGRLAEKRSPLPSMCQRARAWWLAGWPLHPQGRP